MCERLLQVEKLVLAGWIRNRFYLIVEEVVEVGGIQGPAAGKKVLLETCLKGARALGQESWVWSITKARLAENLVEGRFHESRSVGKTQTGSGEYFSST